MKTHSFDVTVIGSGPGGYVAAVRAAQLQKRVALVERDELGGVCLNWGCIPTKALLKIAERYEFLAEAAEWGFDVGKVGVEWNRVVKKSRAAAERLSQGVAYLMKKNKIHVFRGSGRFLSPHRIAVDGPDAVELQTTHTIVATGGRPATLPGVAIDGSRVISSKEAMVLPAIPRSITIIGAGAVGLEFAYFYSVFGSCVQLVEYMDTILPGGDRQICEALARSFKKRAIEIHTGSKVTGVEVRNDSVCTVFEKDGAETELTADVTLMAVGIRGNTDGIGLEEIGVLFDRGFVKTDEHGRTSVEGVYALGDVRGPPALAHVASAEGLHVAEHLAGRNPAPIDYQSVPACIYCVPQVASVGMTEEQARAGGRDVEVGRFPFAANGKAVAVSEVEGFVKIVADKQHGEILGAHIIGPEATELIGELTLAKTAELTVHDVHRAIHSHPTLSESVMEAAADWAGEAVQI